MRQIGAGFALAMCLALAGTAYGQPDDVAGNVTPYAPSFFAQYRPNTAMDMINRIPGFSFDGGSGGRGFAGTAGNVLIDGQRPPSRGDSLSSVISRIPASGVERIDVIRGGAEGVDMQGRSIVANIIRKKNSGLTGSVASNISVNDQGKTSPNASLQLRNQAGGQLAEGSFAISRNNSLQENRLDRRDPGGALLRAASSRTDSRTDRVDATGVWETTALGGKLRLNGLATHLERESDRATLIAFPGGAQKNASGLDRNNGEIGARFSRTLSDGYAMELVGYQSLSRETSDGSFASSGIAGQNDFTSGNSAELTYGETIARGALHLPDFGRWSFETGAEAVFNRSKRDGGFTFNGAPVDLAGSENRVEELRSEGFFTGTWAPSSSFNVETGLRYEWSRISAKSELARSDKELSFFKPRINVSWKPKQGHQWGFRVERGIDQLDFNSFASTAEFEKQVFGVGNVKVEPQKRWEADLRYELQFGGQSNFVAKLSHVYVEDVLSSAILVVPGTPPEPDEVFSITRNGGTATVDLLDLSGTFELDALGMPGGLLVFGGTLSETEMTDKVTLDKHDVDYSAPWSWNLSLQQTLDNGSFRWAVFLEDDADTMAWSPQEIDRFHGGMFLGANVTWKPKQSWTFSAGVNNILAEDGEGRFDFYNAPRTIGASFGYREVNINPNYRTFFVNFRKNF